MGEISSTDKFGRAIIDTVREYNLQKVLEIGSWDGTGSTRCFIEGMKDLKNPDLTCIEVKEDRYKQLVENTREYPWVKCINQTTISLKALIDNDFETLWAGPYNHIQSEKSLAETWYKEDINSIVDCTAGFLESDNSFYDAVLIDGSEFFGYSEFLLVRDRCNVIFLDDYYSAFKTRRAAEELYNDNNWKCIAGDKYTRNGFAVFLRQ